MRKVAIITVNYNGKIDTLELLESLKKLTIDNGELKIVVVDNASSDGSVSAIKAAFPKVDILQTGGNLGFGGGYNKGFEYASIWGADYFFVINNDSKIDDPNILQKLIDVARSGPEIGIVAPKILFEEGFEFYQEKYSKDELGKVIWFGGGSFDWDNIKSVHRGIDQVDHGEYDVIEETEFVSGACFLIKKEVLEKARGFDGDYFLYFEDADFCKRVFDAGFKLYYCGETQIYHKVSQSTGIGSVITDYYHTRNRLIFGMRYAKKRTKFALLREALRLFLFGRPAQRQGVLDHYLGIKGGKAELMDLKDQPAYPLKLSIGIVNYNTPDLTKKLLQSIFKKGSGFDPENMEVIVLDNGQVDPCKEAIKEYGSNIKYLENKTNEGFSKGYNKTIRYALGEYYLMLNSDIEVLENGLKELVKIEDEFGGDAVLGGKLVFPDKTDQDSVFHLPTLTGAFQEYFLGKRGSYFMYQPKGDNPSRVEGLVMACLLIPRNIITNVGLLDEGTFIFFEDIEYARRLKQFGIPLYFVPQAKFIHHHGASTKKIGLAKATDLLTQSAIKYHGKFYYSILNIVLKLGQKFGNVKTPVSRWTKD